MSVQHAPRLAAFVLLLITACSRPADLSAPPPDLALQFGTAGNDRANVVVTDPRRGRVYLAGTTGPDAATGAGGNAFFRRYDRAGRLVWERRANNPGAILTGAATDPSGNAVFSWRTSKSFVTKYSPAGVRLFQLVLRDVGVDGVTTDRQGNVYVAGGRDYSEPRFVRKYTPTGKLVWEKRLVVGFDEDVGPPMLGVADLTATPDGSLYLAGRSVDDYGYLVKLRASDGAVLGHGQLFGSGLEIEASGDNAIYLRTAYEDVLDGGLDYTVYKFRLDLSAAWVRDDLVPTTGGGGNRDDPEDDTLGLSTDASGNVYLTGVYVSATTGETDRFVRKVSAAGGLVFDRRAEVAGSNAAGLGIAALSPGELYLVGTTTGEVNGKNYGGQDAFLIRTDGQGREVWAR